MNLLITNDDGWDAEGIAHLAQLSSQFGTVTVIAPAAPQSGIGHQLTLGRAMDFVQQKDNWFSLDGTPADCVRFGLHHLNRRFDLVLSGINHGANLGVDVFTSGTVAAAREANFHGISAVAFSQYRSNMNDRDFNWKRSAEWTSRTLEYLLSKTELITDQSAPTLYNVNLPDPASDTTSMPELVDCETDRCPLPTDYQNSQGQVRFSGSYQNRLRSADHDVDVCFGGRISISRL
jgi:5'-nucleotidase